MMRSKKTPATGVASRTSNASAPSRATSTSCPAAQRAAMAAEKAPIKEVLEKVKWNRAEAARLLKISYKAMLYKIRQVGLDDRRERGPGRK